MAIKKWKSWQFGAPGSILYRFYDSVRRKVNIRLVRYLVGQLGNVTNAVVLEAGSGTAFASSLFAKNESLKLSIALDFDLQALREAKTRDHELPVVLANLNQLPFKPSAFDLIWNSSTMEHLEDPHVILMEFLRLLQSEGKIFIGVPYKYGPLGIQALFSYSQISKWIGPVFDHAMLTKLFSEAGLKETNYFTYFINCFIGITGRKPHTQECSTH